MIHLAVIDLTAGSRHTLVERLTRMQRDTAASHPFCPQISLNSYSLDEARFNEAADCIIIGRQLLKSDLAEVASIRRLFPAALLIAELPPELDNFMIIEQMSRLGIRDVLTDDTSAADFFRRLLVCSRERKQSARGKLIAVDSGKGGLGVTTLAASLGAVSHEAGLSTVLVDLDGETQDLARFSGSRPVHNENLDLLLLGQRPLTAESVQECLISCGPTESGLMLASPTTVSWQALDSKSSVLRNGMSFFEILDELYATVIVDMANVRGALRKFLMKAADGVVVVAGQDPAALFATGHLLQQLREEVRTSGEARMSVVMNGYDRRRLPLRYIQQQLGGDRMDSNLHPVPQCSSAGAWPGSGKLPLVLGSRAFRKSIRQLSATMLGLMSAEGDEGRRKAGLAPARNEQLGALEASVQKALPHQPESDPFEAGLLGRPVIHNA